MKTIIASTLALLSSIPATSDGAVMNCQMNIMHIEKGKMYGEPHAIAEAILTSDSRQFYAVVGDRVISSPILSERKGDLAAYQSGVAYFMRKDTF